MDLLQIIGFLLEFLTVIELTPQNWFEQDRREIVPFQPDGANLALATALSQFW